MDATRFAGAPSQCLTNGVGPEHGRAVIQQGYRVYYREAHTLAEELADATLDGTRKIYLADLAVTPPAAQPQSLPTRSLAPADHRGLHPWRLG